MDCGGDDQLLLKVLPDIPEDLADDWAEEQQSHDHDDRDEGQEQTVLNKGLTLLILAPEPSDKSADELKHVVRYLLSLQDW